MSIALADGVSRSEPLQMASISQPAVLRPVIHRAETGAKVNALTQALVRPLRGASPSNGVEDAMKRFSFELGPEFRAGAAQVQLGFVPAVQIWEMLSLREREPLKRHAPAFGRASAGC